MEELLPYYERELGILRRYSREFAERYPKIAGRLLMAGEASEDPHVERMIQSYALLNARTAKKLEDSNPEFTEALFEVLYPHYLRAFPSCSIARLDCAPSITQSNAEVVLPRGTEMSSKLVRGVSCRFRSAYDVSAMPINVLHAQFDAIASFPDDLISPVSTTSKISIDLEITSEQFAPSNISPKTSLRFFIDGEPSFCAIFRDAMFMKTVQIYVECGKGGRWNLLDASILREVGFSESDALIDFPERSHPAYRLLTEYFAFPEKNNFFDIDKSLLSVVFAAKVKKFTLHFLLADVRSDSHIARVLSTLHADNIRLGCTPVINLFKQRGDPIRLSHTAADYSVLPDSRRSFAYDVYSIDSVKLVKQSPNGESVTEFRPFYSLKHGQSHEKHGHYWFARRNESLSQKSPGHETRISIVDVDFNPASIEADTLSIGLTCTNRDLPALLAFGASGGDLFIEGGGVARTIQLLRKPTAPIRLQAGNSRHWRLISHLALNHLSLTKVGLDFIREIFYLYSSAGANDAQKKIDSIVDIQCESASAWMAGNPFACLIRGMDVTLTIDDTGFVGSSVHAFISMFDYFLGLYVHTNSFTRLIVKSSKTGQELRRCPPRSGNLSLL